MNKTPTLPSSTLSTFTLPRTVTPYLILALILPIFAIAPLFYPGYIQTHSGFVPLWNVADLRANFGTIGWLPHLATTFDPLRSDGLLPYYLAAMLPVSPVAAVKIVMGLGWLLGSLGMFLWLRSWLGQPGALISALVYTYPPHQIVTVYVRGAWGETLFWGLLPWAILVVTSLINTPNGDASRPREAPALRASANVPFEQKLGGYLPSTLLAAFFWLLLGLSQLGLTLWAWLFLFLLLLIVPLPQARLPLLAAGLGVMMVLVLSVALSPLSTGAIPLTEHFLYPFQLVSAYWGVGVSTSSWDDGLSLQLGLAAVGLSMLTLILWQRPPERVSRTDRRLLFFAIATLVLILLQLGVFSFIWSLPIWPGLALSDILTYPWQLSGFIGLCLAVLSGAALWLDEQLTCLPLGAALIILVILSSYSYLTPQFIQAQPYGAGPQAILGETQVALLSHNFTVQTEGHTAGLEIGPTTIPLDIHGPLQADNTLLLNVMWQPLRPFADDLKIFVHLVDPNNNVLAQFDGPPQQVAYPTSHWLPGELIADSYPILFPTEAPPGPYRVFLGLYDETTFARLPVPTDSEGRVMFKVE